MKIDIDDKGFAANLLLLRMKEKQEKEIAMSNSHDKKDAEGDCLFYWILSQLYAKMDSTRPAKKSASIKVTGSLNQYDNVLLAHGKLDDYLPFYVEGKEFFDVIKDTIETFDEIYGFNATYFQTSSDTCEFTVSISI